MPQTGRWALMLLVLLFGLALCWPAAAEIPNLPPFDVPRIEGIRIDGNADDWADKGFRVDIMTAVDGRTLPPANFDPVFRLAWNEQGLLLLIVVRDDVATESNDENTLAQKDSIEIVLAAEFGGEDHYHLIIAPGFASESAGLRAKTFDWRKKEPKQPIAHEAVARRDNETGTVEILLPWSNLGILPERGAEAALQLLVNDADGDGPRFQAAWYPSAPPSGRTRAMHRIRLSSRPSRPVHLVAHSRYTEWADTKVDLVGVSLLDGKTAAILDGRTKLSEATLPMVDGRPRAELTFPMPDIGTPRGRLDVRVRGARIAQLFLLDADVWRAQRLMTMAPVFKPPVFSGTRFPSCDFPNPLLAQRLIGPYAITASYYDEDYNKVESAARPGRYGAVIEIIPEKGTALRRYATLYRQQNDFNVFSWWFLKPEMTVSLPRELGIDHAAILSQSVSIGRFMQWQLQDAFADDRESAIILAGLAETPPDSPHRDAYTDAYAMDRQWWVGLKRKLGGMESYYPHAFVCPYPNAGSTATTLRDGTPAEAGMKADVIDSIDAVCQAWVEESKEPFAVCVARHGVVFFERAYGERDGKPMTVDTPSWMASITKFLSGVLMMTLVDQGLVELDAPIDNYLPQLRGIKVETPLTIRHLYAHTNGLQLGLQPPRMFTDHWGDEMNDLEEVIAGYYPHLEVGTRHGYNGVGYALAGKIIEQITGEALPQFFQKHMWGPLGCSHTESTDMSARAFSTPRDIATFGQMLLNKGAYGDMRFFSEDTLRKLLPVKLAEYGKHPPDIEWGIGAVWMRDPGLGKNTFAHGAASAATFRIDPDNDLVIVMTRNRGGPAWGTYHPRFIQAIVEGME